MESPWQRVPFGAAAEARRSAPGRDPHLVVVGAGMVGLFTALHYKRAHPDHRVLVLERGGAPSGASMKNAGFACFGSPSELLADVEREGADAMLMRVEERWRGLLELRAELGDANIGFEATGGHEIYAASDPLYPRVAERFTWLNEQLKAVISPEVFRWDPEASSRFGLAGITHVARTHHEGPLDSGKLMRALWGKAIEAGVDIRPGSSVIAVDEGDAAVSLQLADGSKFNTGCAVIATNGYALELFPQIDVRPARGQVLLTSVIPGLRLKGTFHFQEGYYYFRDLDGRVLLGGGRNLDPTGETTTEDAVTHPIQSSLERMLREMVLPGHDFTIEQRWSGIMGFREKGKTPLVEHLSPRVIAAVGLSGMGVAIGIRVARKAAALAGS